MQYTVKKEHDTTKPTGNGWKNLTTKRINASHCKAHSTTKCSRQAHITVRSNCQYNDERAVALFFFSLSLCFYYCFFLSSFSRNNNAHSKCTNIFKYKFKTVLADWNKSNANLKLFCTFDFQLELAIGAFVFCRFAFCCYFSFYFCIFIQQWMKQSTCNYHVSLRTRNYFC